MMNRWILLLLGMLPVTALAQDPCAAVPGGCASGGTNVLLNAIPALASLLIGTAAGASVLFVVLGGAQLMMNFGDESNAEKGKKHIIYALGGFALVLASQSIVSFVFQRSLGAVGTNPIIGVLQTAVTTMVSLFNIAFVIMVVYAGYRMVFAQGKTDEFQKGQSMLKWAAGGAIVINIANVLVKAILNLGL